MNTAPLRLLIAEDEAAHVEAIRRAYETAGTKVDLRAVATLREYRACTAEWTPDLALVDLNLPDGRAVEVLTHPPEDAAFPVLVMTAYGNQEIVVEVMKAGALDYVVKSREAFAAMPHTVERVFREWRLLQEHKQLSAALKKSEAQHVKMVANIGDVIVIIDRDGNNRYKSANIEKLFGWRPDEVVGVGALDNVHPEDLDHAREFIGALFREPNATGRTECRYRCKDGHYKWIEFFGVNLAHDRDIQGLLGNYHDITERKRAEAALLRSYEELERRVAERTVELSRAKAASEAANQAKSEFLAGMSHELRTPLNAVIGFAQMLGEQYCGPLNPKQAEYVRDIISSGKHLLELINDVLDLSKVEAGKTALTLTEFPVRDIVAASLLIVREKAAERGVKLDAVIPPELMEFRIRADLRLLKQVLFNLLANAVKFTPRGGEIHTSAYLTKSEGGAGGALIITVSDTGIGLAPEEIEKVFEEFYQVANHAAGKAKGTGLGLALSRRFVALHGGRLWVESAGLGKGSTFSFSVPVGGTKAEV